MENRPMVRQVRLRVAAPAGKTLPIRARMPGEGLPYWPRLILGPCEKSYCTLLSDQVWTYYVHHAKKTYVPCFAEDGMPCEHCGPNGPRRVYQGSVPVWRQGSREIW